MNEALRLAQFLENDVPPFSAREVKTAAAELRRLHALNAELVEALQQIANVNAMNHEYQHWARAHGIKEQEHE